MEKFRRDIEDLRLFRGLERRRAKVYAPRFNPLNLTDSEFRQKYRFTKENMLKVVEIVHKDLEGDARGGAIPVQLQVMAAVRYWGRQENQDDSAKIHGFSQQTMSRIAKRVAIALASKTHLYIEMPTALEDQAKVMGEFGKIAGFPHVIGAIDCIHTKIRRVGGEEGKLFINSKGNYSIKNQVVCGPNLKIFDIVCQWPGSTHDARILEESNIKQRFEANEFKGYLIGDGGYQSLRYLLTPVPNSISRPEEEYNYRHFHTRSVVERCFSLWKGKFRILLEVMRGSYDTIKATIIACAVLHNLSIEWNDIVAEDYVEVENYEIEENILENENITRSIFIHDYFNQHQQEF